MVCTIVYEIFLKRKFALTLVVLQGLDIILLVFSFTSVTLMGNARNEPTDQYKRLFENISCFVYGV